MKKTFLLSLALVLAFMVSMIVSAGYVLNSDYELWNSKTSSTPYGTMEAKVSGYHELKGNSSGYTQHYYFLVETNMMNGRIMSAVTTKYSVVNRDTGASVMAKDETWRDSNDCIIGGVLSMHESNQYPAIIYSTHEVISTDAYPVYLSTVIR